MAIQEIKDGDVLVIVPDKNAFGRDEANAAEAKLAAAIKTGTRFVVLDCSLITQITSDATRVLLMSSRKLSRLDGRLVLCGMNAKLKKAFSVSGFNKDFTVVVTREEAVQRVVEPVEKPQRVVVPLPPRPARAESPSAGADAPVEDATDDLSPDAPTVVGVPKMPSAAEESAKDAPTLVGAPKVSSDAPTIVGVPKMAGAPGKPASDVEPDAATVVVVTKVPSVDPRETMAAALFDAMGVDVSRRGPAHYRSAAPGSDAAAAALLAALQTAAR